MIEFIKRMFKFCKILYHQELLSQLDDKLETNSEGTRMEDIGDTVV